MSAEASLPTRVPPTAHNNNKTSTENRQRTMHQHHQQQHMEQRKRKKRKEKKTTYAHAPRAATKQPQAVSTLFAYLQLIAYRSMIIFKKEKEKELETNKQLLVDNRQEQCTNTINNNPSWQPNKKNLPARGHTAAIGPHQAATPRKRVTRKLYENNKRVVKSPLLYFT
jgi:hypothetical protein